MPTDQELVRRAQAGDRRALDVLVERHHGAVYRLAVAILQDEDQADDATQNCFLKAVRGLEGFRGDASFRTWLLAIARNEARAQMREGMRRREVALTEPGLVAASGRDPVTRIHASREATRIREAVAELPEKQRLAVSLRIDEGLSFREVGEIIGSSELAARVNYHHGIKRLRERFDER